MAREETDRWHESWWTDKPNVGRSISVMKNINESAIAQAGGAPVASQAEAVQPVYQQIKLALNVHAGDLMVVRRVDGAKPQPPQKMSTERFLEWVGRVSKKRNGPRKGGLLLRV